MKSLFVWWRQQGISLFSNLFQGSFVLKGCVCGPLKFPKKTTQESSIFWEIDNFDLWFPPRLYQVTLIAMWRICQWGGEFELLMLSQVLSRCIEVYMMTERTLTKVQTYGERFICTAPKPICLLLEDCHYFALVEDTF